MRITHTAGYLFDKLMECFDVLMTAGAPFIEVNGNVGVKLNVRERQRKNALCK